MRPLTRIESRSLVLSERNIDTDQIIPARFLTTTSRDGLGQAAFADWRFDGDGLARPDCPLNAATADRAAVLVAGENFGCGSSREHAVWALQQFGFQAVISARIADIFRGNALKNGLLAFEVDADTQAWLLAHPGADLVIDVAAARLHLPDGRAIEFSLDPFARICLLEGVDALGYLIRQQPLIERYERDRREAA